MRSVMRGIAILLCVYLSACKTNQTAVQSPAPVVGTPALISSSPSPTPSPSPSPIAVIQPLLRMTLKSAYESSPNSMANKIVCEVANGSPSGTVQNCAIGIPEGELYYSVFQIDLKVAKSACQIVKFFPYSYQRSNSAGFIPAGIGNQSVDCSGSLGNLPLACFGGVGKELVSGFPQNTAITAVPTTTWTRSIYINSSHSLNLADNRRISNDLGDRLNPIILPADGYIGGSTMQDYELQCLDSGNNVTQKIILTVSQNGNGAGTYKSWTNLPIAAPPTTPPPLSVKFSLFNASDTNLQNPVDVHPCDVTTGSSNDCTFTYPEALLYYSKARISVSIPPNTCDFFRFYPYYYRASNSNGFNPEWSPQTGTGLNCYGLSNSADPRCFSGAALSIIPQGPSGQNSFPLNKSLTYFPGSSLFSQSWTIPSAFDSNRKSNRWMASNLASVNRNSQITLQGDSFAGGGEFQDYVFTCYQNDGTSKYSSVVHVNTTPAAPADTLQDWTNVPLAPPPPMSVQVATYWEDDVAKQFPTLQPNPPKTFVATTLTPNLNDNVLIPSAQLYYSQLQFSLSVPPNTCDIVEFSPYNYLASTDAAYTPQWNMASPIDCSKAVKPIDCFSGPAEPILKIAGVPFPQFGGIVYFPAKSAFGQSWTAPAANSKGRMSNQYTANTLSSAARTADQLFGTGYAAGTMQDWTFTCRGTAGQLLYSIILHVTPTLANGTPDDSSAWNGL